VSVRAELSSASDEELGDRNDLELFGFIDANTRAIFGRSYAAEPDALIEQLKKDEASPAGFQNMVPGAAGRAD
jgi:hypothetical protein